MNIDKNFWTPILKECGIAEHNYDKMIQYIENHTNSEINGWNVFNLNKFKETTLPQAIKALSKLDLDNITIVDASKFNIEGKEYLIESYQHGFKIENYDSKVIEDITNLDTDLILSNICVEETVNKLKVMNETYNLYIYILFSDITNSKNDNIKIVHRFTRTLK